MARKVFEQALAQVQEDVLALASLAERALMASVYQLAERDIEGARELIQQDEIIDERRYALESDVLTLIATQTPLAGDMRALAAALFISNELERIADYGKGIARVNVRIGSEPLIKPLIDIPRMAKAAQGMLRGAVDAYARRDATLARQIITQDDQVDALYDQVYAELMALILEKPAQMRQANLLLMAAHNLERAADRATNIGERVVYAVTGEFLESDWQQVPRLLRDGHPSAPAAN